MARHFLRVASVCLLVLAAIACGTADSPGTSEEAARLSASTSERRSTEPWGDGGWVRAGNAQAITGAYLTLHNPLDREIVLLGAASAAVDTVELHETMDHDGMVHMSPVTRLPIAARDSVRLAPGGLHLMLRGLVRALEVGDTVPLSLTLSTGESIPVLLAVQPIQYVPPDPSEGTPPPSAAGGRSPDSRDVDSIVAAIRSCERDGSWRECSLTLRLQQAGLRTTRSDSLVALPGVSDRAMRWEIGSQQMYIVLYASAQEADAAFALLDSSRALPRGDATARWPQRATLLRSANLLGVLFGGTERAIERVSNAITAGPPQPAR